ncbi:hypothetical protein [Nonlabens xylanidelens]|uniref:hypothetical protein n=1 Tax=Nonlabens xylanidelens TaxID=191564 RepID=UPI001473B987|nr:hypothetical protein [Nonlabens xylanidelens]
MITDEDGNAQTVTTDANGAYTAIVVAAGDATVDIDETTFQQEQFKQKEQTQQR